MNKTTFRITGQVDNRCGPQKGGFEIQAWDKDLRIDEYLACAVTDEAGEFTLTFDESCIQKFQKVLQGRPPDVFFKVFYKGRLIANTKDTLTCNMTSAHMYAGKIELCPKTTVSGRLVYSKDKDGKTKDGVPGVMVRLRRCDADDAGVQTYETTSKGAKSSIGEFSFSEVYCPGESCLELPVEIDANPTSDQPRLKLSDPALTSIVIPLNSCEAINIGEVPYEPAGGVIRGVLFLDQDGSGTLHHQPRLSGVRVRLLRIGDTAASARITNTDIQGNYLFSDLDSNRYALLFERQLDAAPLQVGSGSLSLPSNLPGAIFLPSGGEKIQNVGYRMARGAVRGIVFFDRDGGGHRFGDEPGIPNVTVVLTRADGSVAGRATTDDYGGYLIEALPGSYTLRFPNEVILAADGAECDAEQATQEFHNKFGDQFILTTRQSQDVKIVGGDTVDAVATGYQAETHEIRGRVVDDTGAGLRGVIVVLLEKDRDSELARTVTDPDGFYRFTDFKGDFRIKFPESPEDGVLITPEIQMAHVESIFQAPNTVYRVRRRDSGGGDGTAAVTGRGVSIEEALIDIASYMPTAQETGGPAARVSAGAARGQAQVQQVIDGAIAGILGRRITRTDGAEVGAAFDDSLKRAFKATTVNGRTEYQWQPRAYVVQAELGGAITGAQASIYRRAKAALDDALPLLDGLKPLLPNPDTQEVEAARSIVRTEFIELVNELGLEGGPRVTRVDQIFEVLLAEIERLRTVFGLEQGRVITVDEEQTLTHYFIIRDYARGLTDAWFDEENGYRIQFTGTDPRALGTQFVLLARALASVAESAEETTAELDSVNVGLAERQTVRIEFPDTIVIDGQNQPILLDERGRPVVAPAMTVEDLLAWVMRYATFEATALIQDGGRRGVERILPVAERLQRLVLGAAQTTRVPHVGFTRPRVRRSWTELASQLGQVAQLAREVLLRTAAGSGNGTGPAAQPARSDRGVQGNSRRV